MEVLKHKFNVPCPASIMTVFVISPENALSSGIFKICTATANIIVNRARTISFLRGITIIHILLLHNDMKENMKIW